MFHISFCGFLRPFNRHSESKGSEMRPFRHSIPDLPQNTEQSTRKTRFLRKTKWTSLLILSLHVFLTQFFTNSKNEAKQVNYFFHLYESSYRHEAFKILITKLCVLLKRSYYAKPFKMLHVDRNDMIISLKSVLTNGL